jgi:hypothetical protein
MNPVPHEDLRYLVPPTKWKELSVLNEENNCMEGLSVSSLYVSLDISGLMKDMGF